MGGATEIPEGCSEEGEEVSDVKEEQRAWVQGVVAAAQERRWFGSIVIKMEAGCIKRVEKTEILIPPGVTPPKSA